MSEYASEPLPELVCQNGYRYVLPAGTLIDSVATWETGSVEEEDLGRDTFTIVVDLTLYSTYNDKDALIVNASAVRDGVPELTVMLARVDDDDRGSKDIVREYATAFAGKLGFPEQKALIVDYITGE